MTWNEHLVLWDDRRVISPASHGLPRTTCPWISTAFIRFLVHAMLDQSSTGGRDESGTAGRLTSGTPGGAAAGGRRTSLRPDHTAARSGCSNRPTYQSARPPPRVHVVLPAAGGSGAGPETVDLLHHARLTEPRKTPVPGIRRRLASPAAGRLTHRSWCFESAAPHAYRETRVSHEGSAFPRVRRPERPELRGRGAARPRGR